MSGLTPLLLNETVTLDVVKNAPDPLGKAGRDAVGAPDWIVLGNGQVLVADFGRHKEEKILGMT